MKKLIYSFAIVPLLFLLSASLAQAGGWAVVTLDSLPKEVVVGQPFTVGFAVRQHGRTLMSGLAPKITAFHSFAVDNVIVTAKPISNKVGHYEATLTLPTTGEWKWSVDAFGAFAQPMPTLNVLASVPLKKTDTNPVVSATPATTTVNSIPGALPLVVGLVGVIGAGVALFYWFRTQARSAFALSILAALIGMGALAFASLPAAPSRAESSPVVNAQSKPSAAEEAALTTTQYGRDLFLAKGCVVCHAHVAFASERTSAGLTGFKVGPDLTDTKLDPTYMHKWLKDPAAAKGPAVEMPTLGLSDEEIDALVVFLTTYKAQ